MKKQRWTIEHEDDHLLVISKPPYLLSVPDRYDKSIPNLYSQLLTYRESIFINHRIDKQTSGLILFSKTKEAYQAISTMMEERKIEKLYYAICHHVPAEEVGLIDLPLDTGTKKGSQVDQDGKVSLTKYRIIHAYRNFAYCEINLLTGRQHQIRAHFKAIGCPLLCDENYGAPPDFYLSTIKRKYRRPKDKEEQPLISRVALHAHALSFVHPMTEQPLDIKCDIPKDMRAVLRQLDKNNPS